jgi:hypothetical protein
VDWALVESRKSPTAVVPHPSAGTLNEQDANTVLKLYKEMADDARELYELGESSEVVKLPISEGGPWYFGVNMIDFYPDFHPRMRASAASLFALKSSSSSTSSAGKKKKSASAQAAAAASSSQGLKI